ncbi:hypothetical protein AHAS_Ahas19G0039000 [Arachis hypogaea]
MVAASDFSKDFRLRRDCIAEMFFSCKQTRCMGCDRVELSFSGDDVMVLMAVVLVVVENKVNSSRDDIDDHGDMDVNRILSNYSFGEAETTLTDEMEDQ